MTISMKTVNEPYFRSLDEAKKVIEKINKKNKFDWDITIILDYKLNYAGLYIDEEPNTIRINPDQCADEIGEYSLFYVIIHEYCHLLDKKLKIVDKFKQQIRGRDKRLILNPNSETNKTEELTEIMTLYISNPFLLKLMSKLHWQFLKNVFKSPTICSYVSFVDTYKNWTKQWKINLKKQYGIYVRGETIYFME